MQLSTLKTDYSALKKQKSSSTKATSAAKKSAPKKKTATKKKAASSTSKTTASKKAKPDNLKRIEGIGPKIEKLLHAAGVDSFHKLSSTSQKKLKSILLEAGPRFASHSPETWPEQAKLAADGEWDQLKTRLT